MAINKKNQIAKKACHILKVYKFYIEKGYLVDRLESIFFDM